MSEIATRPFLRARPRATSVLVSLASLVLGVLGCGAPPTEAELAASEPAPVVLSVPADLAPSHDGTLVMAGAYPVEVVPHASGEIYAYVRGDAPPPSTATELAVIVPVTGGVRGVELDWDPHESRWGGHVQHAEVVPGPIDVVLVVGGARSITRTTSIAVRPAVAVVAAPAVVAPVVVAPHPVVVVPVYEEEHHGHDGWEIHGPHGHGPEHGFPHGHGLHFPH